MKKFDKKDWKFDVGDLVSYYGFNGNPCMGVIIERSKVIAEKEGGLLSGEEMYCVGIPHRSSNNFVLGSFLKKVNLDD